MKRTRSTAGGLVRLVQNVAPPDADDIVSWTGKRKLVFGLLVLAHLKDS
jgi:hypothetical protein